MRPLSVAAAGLVLVAIDFRTRSADWLPDVLGWLLVAAACWLLLARLAAMVALAAAALSVSELSLPYHLVRISRETGEVLPSDPRATSTTGLQLRWDDLSDVRAVLVAAAIACGAVAMGLLLWTLVRRAAAERDAQVVRRLRLAGVLVPPLAAAPFVVLSAVAIVGSEGYDPVWNGTAEVLGLVSIVPLLGLAALFVLRRDSGWALPPETAEVSPWEARRRVGGDQRIER